MDSVRVSSGERVPSYRNTMAGLPSPMSSFSENDAFSTFYHNMLAKSQTAAPALPMKSKLRASRLIIPTSLVVPVQQVSSPVNEPTTHHDVYMSSEEDASSTADDVSDYDWDSESDEVCAPLSFSVSNPARIVSVVYSGKPAVVELSGRRSTSPSLRNRQYSADSESSIPEPPTRLAPPVAVHPSSFPIRPVSTFTPARLTSEFIPRGMPRQRSAFLNVDPSAAPPSHNNHSSLTVSPTSVTAEFSFHESAPTSSASNVFKRTISLVRKKSRPTLNNSNLPSTISEEVSIPQTAQISASLPVTPGVAPATYEDMLLKAALGAKHNVSSPTPSTASATSDHLTSPQLSTPMKNRLLSLTRKRSSWV